MTPFQLGQVVATPGARGNLKHRRVKLCECGCGCPTSIAPKTDTRRGHVKGEPVQFISGHHARCQSKETRLKRAKANSKHGMWHTPEYRAYFDAKTRCTKPKNKRFKDYGGRGIKFLFASFEQFFKELGKRPTPLHSLDRINNDSHYKPGNVRWATKKQQIQNQRKAA